MQNIKFLQQLLEFYLINVAKRCIKTGVRAEERGLSLNSTLVR